MKKIIYSLFTAFLFQFGISQTIVAPPGANSNTSSADIRIGAGHDISLFPGTTSRFEAEPGALSYLWRPSIGLSDSTVSNPFVTLNSSITYTLRIETQPSSFSYYSVTAFVGEPTSVSSVASCSNWVENGDFEANHGCVNLYGWLTANNWFDAGGTCDYYSTCVNTAGGSITGVPINAVGTQNSSVYGDAYTGLIINGCAEKAPYFEYFEQQLPCSLVSGQRYKLSFDASWADQSNFYCGNIGMLLSTTNMSAPLPYGSQIIATPQVDGACSANPSWQTFTNTFIAAGEQFLTIGNFDANSADPGNCIRRANNVDPLTTPHDILDFSYNYVDNIVVTPIIPDINATYTVACAGLATPPSIPDNILTAVGSPGSLCVWTGPSGYIGTGQSVQIITPTTPGIYTYTLSVDLSSQCSLCSTPLTNTIAITVKPLIKSGVILTPTITPGVTCANAVTGVGTVVGHVSGGTTSTVYVWSPALTPSNTHNNSGHLSKPPGVYTVNVTTSGCTGFGTTTFTINPFPVFTTTTSTPSICYGVNTATLTASNPDPSITYTWAPATELSATTGSVVVANPSANSIYSNNHIYTVHALNGFGCVNIETVGVQTSLPPTINIPHRPSLSYCSQSPSITTFSVGGVGSGTGGTYQWSSGQTTPTITVEPTVTTSYSVVGTTSAGCSSSSTVVTLSVIPTPTVVILAPLNPICAGTAPTLTAVVNPTNSTTTYDWLNWNATTNPFTPFPPENSTHTQYTYTVIVHTDGCVATATLSPPIIPLPPAPALSGVLCKTVTSVMTVANSTAGETYTWSAPTGSTIICDNPPYCSQETINNAVGTYSVVGTDINGCISATTTISPKPVNPTQIIVSNSYPDCANSLSTFTLTGDLQTGLNNTYVWNTGETTASIVVSPSVTTTYSVTGTNGTSGCASVNPAVYTITVTPNPILTASSSSVCSRASVTLTATNNQTTTHAQYTWSGYGINGTNEYNNPLIVPYITTPQTFTLNGNIINGCPGNPVTITVVPLARPVISIIPSSSIVCQGSSSTLTVNGDPANTYSWNASPALNTTTGAVVIATPQGTATDYTVTAVGANGCTSQAATTVEFIPTASVSITAPIRSVCPGGSVVLTANGSQDYTWTPANGLNTSSTSSVIAVNPTSTTVYTVTAGNNTQISCTNQATIAITVKSAPNPIIMPASNPICSNTTTTLTATGANTYTWTGTVVGGIHNSVVTTPNLSTTTTYTLSGSLNGCDGSSVFTESVTPAPTLSITTVSAGNCTSSNYNGVCNGDAITITASSATATDYTWNPGNLSSNVITVSPTVNTNYTVEATDGVCTTGHVITIAVRDCAAGITNLPHQGTTASGATYVAVTSFTLSNNLIINGSIVDISPNVTITVPPKMVLNIKNSHLKALSNTMWQGIVVQPGGTVTVNNNSMIEDAIVAIDNNPTNAVQTGAPAVIDVSGSIFNCNRTAIRNAFQQSTNAANYLTAVFAVNSSVITCRCGITQSAGVAPLIIYSGGGTVANPTINDFYSVANYASTTLKAPYFGQPAFEGIHLENTGDPGGSNYLSIGKGLLLFDNLTYGVNTINTTFSITTSAFQNPYLAGAGGLQNLPTIGGYGINAVSNLPANLNGMYVNLNNQFIGMVRAINSINYYFADIEENTIFSKQVASSSIGSSLIPASGSYGVFIKTPYFKKAVISSNNIVNINTGIDFVIDANPTYVSSGDNESVGPITISTNTITSQFSNVVSHPGAYIGNAIIVDNVVTPPNSLAPVAGDGTRILVQQNNISNAFRGILIRNQQYQSIRDENNTISLQLEPTNFATPTTQYGIEHINTGSKKVDDIFNNNITGFTTNYSNPTTFETKKGIWSNLTHNHYVTCNTVTNAGRAIEFSGLNSGTFFRLNQMNTSGEGFVLSSNSGGGIIGTQGTANSASDNQWTGFAGVNFETFTDANSPPNSSTLYIQSSLPTYTPIYNVSNGGTQYSNGNGLALATQPSSYQCSTVIPARVIHSSQTANARNANSNIIPSDTQNDNNITLFEKIVLDSLPYTKDSIQNTFVNKDLVYRIIRQDASLLDSSTILQNFYSTSQGTSRQLFCAIEDSLYHGSYNYANSLINGFMPTCTIEQNYKRFYQIYISGKLGIAANADTTDLETIASSCPLLNGSVVYQARAFHNSWYNDFKHYEDNCPQNNKDESRLSKNQSVSANNTNSLLVYPNPTNGKVYVSGFNINEKTTNVEITDIAGKLVYKQQNNIENGIIEFNLPFVSGVYFIHALTSSCGTQVQKIIINN